MSSNRKECVVEIKILKDYKIFIRTRTFRLNSASPRGTGDTPRARVLPSILYWFFTWIINKFGCWDSDIVKNLKIGGNIYLVVTVVYSLRRHQRPAREHATCDMRSTILSALSQYHKLILFSCFQVFERVIKKIKNDNQKILFYNVPVELMSQMENIEGVIKQSFRATSVQEALAVIEEKAVEANESTALMATEPGSRDNV